jgi:hypothetical protein
MFARPSWNIKRDQGILNGANPVPPTALPIIHEDSLQNIQGGLPNQHYHLNATEYANMRAGGYEPSIICGEILLDTNGEIVMQATA